MSYKSRLDEIVLTCGDEKLAARAALELREALWQRRTMDRSTLSDSIREHVIVSRCGLTRTPTVLCYSIDELVGMYRDARRLGEQGGLPLADAMDVVDEKLKRAA